MEIAHSILFSVLGLGMFSLIALIYWIEWKKSQNGQNKRDPMTKGIIWSLVPLGIMFIAEAVGYFEKGWVQKNFWIPLLIAFCIVGVYMYVASRKKAYPYPKQKERAHNHIFEEFRASNYSGEAFIPWLVAYKLTIEDQKNSESTRGEVGNFLVLAQVATKTIFVFVQLNIYTLQLLHLQIDPPAEHMIEVYGKNVPTKDSFLEEFEGKKQDGTSE